MYVPAVFRGCYQLSPVCAEAAADVNQEPTSITGSLSLFQAASPLLQAAAAGARYCSIALSD